MEVVGIEAAVVLTEAVVVLDEGIGVSGIDVVVS